MISLTVINQAPQGYKEHDPFRHRYGHPYPGDPKEPRQQQDTAAEQAEGPEEGQDGGDLAVGEGGKQGGDEDVEAAEEKAYGEDRKARCCDLINPGGIWGERTYDQGTAGDGKCKDQQRSCCEEADADGKDFPLLLSVAAPVVESDHRRDAHGKADEQGVQQKLRVDHDRDRCHPVLSQPLHHGEVEQKSCEGGCQLADHLGGTVQAAFGQQSPSPTGLYKGQSTPVPEEKDRSGGGRDQISKPGPKGGAPDLHAARDDEDVIQKDVGEARQHGQAESQPRFSGGHEQIRVDGLYHIGGKKEEQKAQIIPAVGEQTFAGAQGKEDGIQP